MARLGLGALIGVSVLVVSVAVAITIGPADLSVRDVFAVVTEHLGGPPSRLSTIRDATETRNRG